MQIPEDPKQICINYAKENKYDEILDYLLNCNFTLIRFISSGEYLLNNCCDNQIYLGQASNFNDIFDCCWKFPQEIIDFSQKGANWNLIDEVMIKCCENTSNIEKQNFFVACFSDKCNLTNPKMWFLYAKEYTGVCLEYKISHLAYILKVRKIISSLLIDFAPITYSSCNGDIHLNNLSNDFYNTVFTKSNSWSDEKEWRLFRKDSKKNKCVIYCKPVSVYLGAKIKANDKNDILAQLSKDVKLYETFFDYTNLQIHIKEIMR